MSAASNIEVTAFPWPAATMRAVRFGGWRTKLSLALWSIDAVIITATVVFTFSLLFDADQRLSGFDSVSYWMLAPVVIVAWLLMLQFTESRSFRVIGSGMDEYRRVVMGSIHLFGVLAISSYLLKVSLSRAMFAAALPLGVGALLIGRWTLRRYVNRLRAVGRAVTPALVVGTGPSVALLLADVAKRPDLGYRIDGVCLLSELPTEDRPMLSGLAQHRLATLADAAVCGRYGAVIVAEGLPREETRNLAWHLEASPIELMFQASLMDVAGPRLTVRDVEGMSLVHVDLPTFTGAKLVIKRAFDVVFSALALIALAPVLGVIALAIKLDDGGPVLFRQQRIGRCGQTFTIHKFRTMCVDAEARMDALIAQNGGTALLFKLKDDPRITRLGAFLRKYSLDELPQFWSVLRGGMSIVGPRPQVAREVAEYTEAHHRRLLIKPGITGLWQVSGRSELSLEESIRLDLRYVENWSLITDLTVIMKTVGVVVRPSGAF